MKIKFLASFACIILLSLNVVAEGWFDGLPDEALNWIYTNIYATGSRLNYQEQVFDNIQIVISFTEGTPGYYATELQDQGYWHQDPDMNFPEWVPNWVEVSVWHEGKDEYYCIKITDLYFEFARYISGAWKRYDTKEEIIKDIKSAESTEARETRLSFDRWLVKWEWELFLRFKAFSTGVAGENKAPLVSSETPVASADKTGIRIVDQLITIKNNAAKNSAEESNNDNDKNLVFSGIITYEDFEYSSIKGETYEVLSEIQYSVDDYTYGVFIPVTYIDAGFTDWNKLGTSAYIKRDFFFNNFNCAAGFSLSAEHTFLDDDEIDDSTSFGAGPLFSLSFNIKGIDFAIGVNYLYMDNSEYDETEILTSAFSCSIPLTDKYHIGLYTYRTDNFDSDNDYWTIGGTGSCYLSDVFGMVLGVNTVKDLDDFESISVHLGGNWKF